MRSTQKLIRALASDGPYQSDGDGEAGRGRDEVLYGQAGHLDREPGTRLPGIGLPVGVGGERDRRIEGRVPVLVPLQAPGQPPLTEDQCPESEDRDAAEGHDGECIGAPPLLRARVDANESIDEPLEGPVPLVREDAMHPSAERNVNHCENADDQGQREAGLKDGAKAAVHCAPQKRSGRASAYTR